MKLFIKANLFYIVAQEKKVNYKQKGLQKKADLLLHFHTMNFPDTS
jgi:hypothetical protein